MQKNEDTHRWPLFLPDGKRFLFWAGNFGDVKADRSSGIFLTTLDANDKQLVLHCHSNFGIAGGQLIFVNDSQQLVSMAFDQSSGHVSGSVDVLAERVGYQPAIFWAALAVARNGTVVYNATSGATRSVLTWMDRSGRELGRLGAPAVMANPAISPDGSRVALDESDPKANAVEVWIQRTDGSASTRFTFDASEDVVPLWSHNGTRIAYRKNSATGPSLVTKKATSLEPENELVQVSSTEDAIPVSWSADDKQIVYMYMQPSKLGAEFELIPADGGRSAPLLSGQGHKTNAQISPDGKWLAYASNESGDWEIYVTTFPGGMGKWQVSRGGGTEPRWRGDGKEIFYLAPGGVITAVPVSIIGTFSSGIPQALFQFHGRAPISSTDTFSYDVTKDGKRFLVNRYVKPDHIEPLTIVLNAEAKSPN
jgi:Tol biopolymer transport system component